MDNQTESKYDDEEDVIDLTESTTDEDDSTYHDIQDDVKTLKDDLEETQKLIVAMSRANREKNEQIEELKNQVDILRNTVRRLRFQMDGGSRAHSGIRDSSFYASFRRHFCENYLDSMRMIGEYEPHQLVFLGHILNLPVSRVGV